MTSLHSTREADTPTAGELPSPGVRTVVNLLLFVHLFSLSLVVIFNASSSSLREKLRNFPGFYLTALYMDVAADSGVEITPDQTAPRADNARMRPRGLRALYHLSQSEALDTPHLVQVAPGIETQDGASDAEPIMEFPNPSIWPGQRYRRYQMLAWEVGRLIGDDSVQSVLPQSITERALAATDADRATFRVQRQYLRSTDDVNSPDPQLSQAWSPSRRATVFERAALVSGGQVLFTPVSPEERASPAPGEGPDPASLTAPPPGAGGPPPANEDAPPPSANP